MKRRKFIQKTSLGIIGIPVFVNAFSMVKPSDKIRIAHIGLGMMGEVHLKWFAAFPDVETVALCDVDKKRLEEKSKLLQSLNSGAAFDVYTDFRYILERNDIDAVTCATPDHWHALITMMAFESGKDVYGEKPLSHNVREGQLMLKSLRKNKAVFQLGTQIHAGENYHRVTEIIQSGILGKIHTVRLWKTGGSPGLGFPLPEQAPDTLDWNMWLGPAPYEEYVAARCHGTYRYFLDYSGGVFGDFWCHIADIVYMSLDPKGLQSIDVRGDRPDDGIADTPGKIEVDFKYNDLELYWTSSIPKIPDVEEMHIGACFEGTEGTLLCDYNTMKIRVGDDTLNDIPEIPKTIRRSPGHQRDFLDSIKSRTQPESNLAYSRKMTLPMHLALIAFRLKRKLKWDSENEIFINDPAANYLLSRTYRKPWTLPVY